MKNIILLGAVLINVYAQCQESPSSIVIDPSTTYQRIDNFAASDAWACQFVGNWPDEKKNVIADWLFSMDTLSNGNPKGIGLTMWRYNIGAGSASQADDSGIKDEWRRAASFTNNANLQDERLRGQSWFLQAAKKRGVQQFLGFFNSPPVNLTTTGRAFARDGICNIDGGRYKDFAAYAIKAIHQIEKTDGVTLNYISPVNEPQWDWSDGGQEGCPYNNQEINTLVKIFNQEFIKNKLTTKLLIPEAGHLKYFQTNSDKPGKDNQVNVFFNSLSPHFVGDLPSVHRSIALHSYFSTSPYDSAVVLRTQLRDSIAAIKGLEFWQTEYCILGDNAGEIDGNKKDLSMNAALYVSRVIHQDLSIANATAWQWWLAVSPYDYKDGLIYIDKNKTDGDYHDSKILWALGNYSRFVRPGMKRIETKSNSKDLLVSAFKDMNSNQVVMVIVNSSATEKPVAIKKGKAFSSEDNMIVTYTTDASRNLKKNTIKTSGLVVPPRSVVSVILDR